MIARKNFPMLSVVVPCYNEEEVIPLTHQHLIDVLGNSEQFELEIVYVNDGSKDNTYELLATYQEQCSFVRLVNLSRNFGHQSAVTAGLDHANGDVVAIIDADLQDPPEVILEMMGEWRRQADVVYGVRQKRKESAFKKVAYAGFYRLWNLISEIEVPVDSGDFCLMDRAVVDEMKRLPERNRFVRGLRSWVGYTQVGLVYERAARAAGETKYPISKLINLARDGLFDFSVLPLRVIARLGFVTCILSIMGTFLILAQRIFGFSILGYTPEDVPGYTSVILVLLLLSGVQMLCLGVIGEYIGRLYEETKRRPNYIVRPNLGKTNSRAATAIRVSVDSKIQEGID